MSATNYLGRTYSDETDWLAVLREAAKYPMGPSWLRSDLDVASGLAELAGQLGSNFEPALAEAALKVVEIGTSAERAAVWQLPWERGNNAVERLLQIIALDRDRLEEVHGVANVLWRLLQCNADDTRLLAALAAEARISPADPWIKEMLAAHSS